MPAQNKVGVYANKGIGNGWHNAGWRNNGAAIVVTVGWKTGSGVGKCALSCAAPAQCSSVVHAHAEIFISCGSSSSTTSLPLLSATTFVASHGCEAGGPTVHGG